ncbi:MAG: hypothetical protein JST87_00540 [Bacteroidetes bacterium]|nr:hypothetical protein [Bacteroidota bacterium]MBS1933261.1 hypothetical protein [Bacteroidota bacterium]
MSKDGIINQLLLESETWKHVLSFVAEENSTLKNRLAGFLNTIDKNDLDLLEKMETFQNLFLKEDEIVRFLKTEVSDQEKLLVRDLYEDGELFYKVKMRQQKLRKDFEKVEEDFNMIKSEFDAYVSENLF